jgi:membrane protease YdiL (CAAX protease family)
MAQPVARIVLAALAAVLPAILAMMLIQHSLDKPMRQVWPFLLCAALCVAGYARYVHVVEQRRVTELAGAGAARELGLGAAIGAAAFLAVIGALFASGAFRVTGTHSWSVLIAPFAELVFVALFEEILFRGILFRIIEKSLGSWLAVLLSSVLFAAAHLPNDGITVLAVAITALAGVMFAAAYMLTRRLWLAIGLHFAWNFMSDAVFSLPTSGHPAKGLLQGQLSGPAWLSGGAYGVEASAVTLVVIGLVTLLLFAAAIRRGQALAPYWHRPALPA